LNRVTFSSSAITKSQRGVEFGLVVASAIHSDDWGDPLGYSITVNRKGEGLETEYSVVPSPAQTTPANILEVYKEKPINFEVCSPEAIRLKRQTA
jgi:hypothetical protein